MLPNILGNVAKHSRECPQTFWGMSLNILGECRKTFLGMSPNILGNVLIYTGECPSAALLLYASSVATRLFGELNQGLWSENSLPQPLCYSKFVSYSNHGDIILNLYLHVQTHYSKKLALDKTNYRPVSVLPPVSKIFERLMQKQINEHIKNELFLSSWGSNLGFCGWFLLCWPLRYGDTATAAIRQEHKPNIKLMKCHPTNISLPWSNVTHFLSLISTFQIPSSCTDSRQWTEFTPHFLHLLGR